jgi:hypothetical protein
MAPPRFSSYASRREGAGRGEARQPPRQARAVRAGAHASHGVSERRRRCLLLGFAEQAAHGCAAQRTRCPRLRCAAPRHASAVASARPGARERRACGGAWPASCAAARRWEARVLCSCLEETRGRGAPHAAAASGPAGGLDVSRRAALSLSRHRRAARPAVSGETTMFASFSSLVESVDLSALADHAGKVRGCRAARLSRRAGGVLTRAGACFARSALAACAAGFRAAGGPGEERRQRAGLPGAGAAGRCLRTAAAAARRRERAGCPGRASRRPAAAAGRASATAAAGAGRVCHQRGGGGSPGSAAGRATQRWGVPSAAARAAALAARAAPAACARARRRCIATRPRPGCTGCFLAPSRVRCRLHAQR